MRSPLTLVTGISLIFLNPACRSLPSKTPPQPQVATALKYAQEKLEFRNPKLGTITLEDGYYSVWVWRSYQLPGDFVIVSVSTENEMFGWIPGR